MNEIWINMARGNWRIKNINDNQANTAVASGETAGDTEAVIDNNVIMNRNIPASFVLFIYRVIVLLIGSVWQGVK